MLDDVTVVITASMVMSQMKTGRSSGPFSFAGVGVDVDVDVEVAST